MRLHVVHADQRDLPGYGKPFGCVDTSGKAGAHAGSPSDGDKIRFTLEDRRMAGYANGDDGRSMV